jgi:hypothetical protein
LGDRLARGGSDNKLKIDTRRAQFVSPVAHFGTNIATNGTVVVIIFGKWLEVRKKSRSAPLF